MNTINALLVIFVVFLVWYFSELPRLYREAKRTKLPIKVSPISSGSLPWLIIQSLLGYNFVERFTPAPLWDVLKYTIVGHEDRIKYYDEQKHGKVFIHVTPERNCIFSTDPDLNGELLSRMNDFPATEGAASEYLQSVMMQKC